MIKWLCIALLLSCTLPACKEGQNIPDVSGIRVTVKVKRFEQDFFAMDTAAVEASLTALQQQYGTFLNDYLYNILSLPAEPDGVVKNVKLFLQGYARCTIR